MALKIYNCFESQGIVAMTLCLTLKASRVARQSLLHSDYILASSSVISDCSHVLKEQTVGGDGSQQDKTSKRAV